MRRKILWITFWTTMAFWLGGGLGCAQEQNYKTIQDDPQRFYNESPTRPGPRDLSRAPAPAATPVLAAATGAASAPARETVASLRGIDRSHWPTVVVNLPEGVVEHFPVYYRDYAPTQVKRALKVDWANVEAGWHQLEHDLGWDDCAAAPATQPAETLAPATVAATAGHATAPAAGPGTLPAATAPRCAMADDVFPALPPAPRGNVLLQTEAPAGEAALREAVAGHEYRGWWSQNNRLNMLVQPLNFALDTLLLPIRAIDNPPWELVTTPP